jgi:DNA-binding NtrC family response regulator
MRQAPKAPARLPGILVVDDERQIVDLLTRYLIQHGFRTVGACSAADARERVRGDQRIAVLVADVRMPGESGVALAEELVRERSRTAALEVVLISGAGLEDPLPEAIRSQGFELLRKPFRPSEMAAAVTRALAVNEQRRRLARTGADRPEAAENAAAGETGATPDARRGTLMPILAAAEALVEAAAFDEAETREHARRIREAALRLLAMIEEPEPEPAEDRRDAIGSERRALR